MSVILTTSVLAALLCVSLAGRLEPQYLPPRPYSSGAYSQASAYSGAGASAGAYSGANSFAGAPFRFDNNNDGFGSYKYSFDGNGISAHESGSPRASGSEGAAVTAEGGFSYRAPDGQQISLTYTADENGFHPIGSHLPTPPPIPEAILRSIQFNRQNPSDDGSYRSGAYGSNGGYHY